MKEGVKSILNNKNGLSTIVATLIIILLVFVAVGILWVVLRNFVGDGAEQISLGKITLSMEIEKVQQIDDTNLNVTVKRNSGAGNFTGINFVIYDISGNNNEVVKVTGINMNELDKRTFSLVLGDVNASEISKVEIYPIFTLESGKEVVGDVKDSIGITYVVQNSNPEESQEEQCNNDCSFLGDTQCASINSFQNCGHFDADSCLEWGSILSCPSGQICLQKECIPSGDYPPAYNNLVTWLRFEGNLYDEKGTNNATLSGSVPYAQGYGNGQSVNFPGTAGNYVNLPIIIANSQLSISFWANVDTTSSIRGFFNYNYNEGYRGRLSSPGSLPQLILFGTSYQSSSPVLTGQWIHYVYTFDSITGKIDVYVDGVKVIDQTRAGGFNLNATYIQIGKSWTSTELYDGRIDEFMIYNKKLNQTEVSDLYGFIL